MQALDEKNTNINNEMIDLTFNLFTKDTESFDSMDASLNILDVANDDISEDK